MLNYTKDLLTKEEIKQLRDEYPMSCFDICPFISHIAQELQETNRFFVDERFIKLLNSLNCLDIFPKVHYKMRKGKIVYRARIIYKDEENKINKEPNFYGFNAKDSFVPPFNSGVRAGRANPSKIIYLYTSSSPKICVGEVRAKAWEKVSVAQILVQEPLEIFNVTAYNGQVLSLDLTPEEFFLMNCLQHIGFAFMQPCQTAEDYLLCQFVSEYIKILGYDGIMHHSSENHQGYNYDIFNYEKCKPISSKIYIVSKANIKAYEKVNF